MKKKLYMLLLTFTVFVLLNLYKNLSYPQSSYKHINKKNKAQEVCSIKTNNNKSKTYKNNNLNKVHILLVNKDNKLIKNYCPENLRIPNVKFISYADPNVKQMQSKAANALEILFEAASKDNINLLAVSGYRPYTYQERLYTEDVSNSNDSQTSTYVAEPGTSEHQTGLAMDVLSDECFYLDERFTETKAYEWLTKNCSKYGFIIRYPKNKEHITKYSFEPWHIRYVGLPHSKKIMDNNLTLEEYVDN